MGRLAITDARGSRMLEPGAERATPPLRPLDWLERRVAAGDWVVLDGSDRTLPGLGKVVEGDYEPRFSVLRLARVEFARGSYWLWPGELVRLEPGDEELLSAAALERELVLGEDARRLAAALHAHRQGTAKFSRSPGLLDLLWSFLPPGAEARRSARGLVGFFDEGARVLATLGRRSAPPVPAPRAALPRAISKPPAPPVLDVTKTDPPPVPSAQAYAVPAARAYVTHAPPPRKPVQSPSDVLDRILKTLNHGALRTVVEKAGIEVTPKASAKEIRSVLVAKAVSLAVVLDALTPKQVLVAVDALGLGRTSDTGELRARIRNLRGLAM